MRRRLMRYRGHPRGGGGGTSMLTALGQIGSLTALSRILGFLRDILIAALIGAGPLADAFFIAFKLPNLFRRLTAEGAMTHAFMPAYARAKAAGEDVAAAMAADVQITLLWALVALTLILEAAMPLVISLLAPGFEAGGERYHQAVSLARLTMPFLPMISLVAFWAAVSNAHNKFWGGAAMPVILNISLIVGALVGGALAGGVLAGGILSFEAGAYGAGGATSDAAAPFRAIPLAVAVPLAGIIQLLFMGWILHRMGRMPPWRWRPQVLEPARRMWRKFFSAAIAAGAMQINLLVDTILASTLPAGAIAGLYYADRVAQLPLGIIGIALGTALLPRLSHLEAAGDDAAVRKALAHGCQTGLFFAIPAAAGAVILAAPLIAGLFAYGEFGADQVDDVAFILMAYGVGIPAFILAKVIQPAFFAANDPGTPLRIALVVIALNIGLSITLMQVLGAAGIALATSLASWVSVIIMGVILTRRRRLDARLAANMPRVVFATGLMAAALVIVMAHFEGVLARTPAFVGLIILAGGGLVVYCAAARVLGIWPLEDTGRQG